MDLIELGSYHSTQEAQVFASALRGHGLHPSVVNDGLANIIGVGYHIVPTRILIPEVEYPDAIVLVEIIKAKMEEPPAPGPKNCPACGESWEPGFSVCWSCSEPLESEPSG